MDEGRMHEELVARGLDALLRTREPTVAEAAQIERLLGQFDNEETQVTVGLIRGLLQEDPIDWPEVETNLDEWVSWFWTEQERRESTLEFQAVIDDFDHLAESTPPGESDHRP
jgi:hypothetical protein